MLPLTHAFGARRGGPGKPSIEGGDASFRYVEAGARMARDGEVDALVTAPISKQWWDRAGHHFPGHSEVMAKIGRSRNWRMMFAGSELRLALVTVHVGLAKVPRLLTQKNVFDTIVILDRHLRENEGADQSANRRARLQSARRRERTFRRRGDRASSHRRSGARKSAASRRTGRSRPTPRLSGTTGVSASMRL